MHALPQTEPASLPAYVTGLNPEQQAAVLATEGPLLVLAGAGTGKTRVLTTRIAHLINSKRAFPGQILSVTFTNKAAAEMRARVAQLLPPPQGEAETGDIPCFRGGGITSSDEANLPPTRQTHAFDPPYGGRSDTAAALWLGTFHSICAKMLRRHAELVGLTPQFTILDDDDQQRLLKALLADQDIDHTKFPTRAVQNVIQGWKDRGLTPDRIPEKAGVYTLTQVAAKLYPLYQTRLKNLNCTDFGDLLLHVLVIFQTHPQVLQSYAERFRYILVDEYQDTNVAQYLWLRLLVAYHKNLCCVGDDDQSIYGWRGAEVGNILKFESDYPGAKIIRLERNYRSTAPILAAAAGLIANNAERLGKTLWTEANEGALVRVKSVWDDNEEARFVGEEIETYQRRRIALKDMAVLVRAGYQTRGFEERFLTLGIPYKVVGGLRFYERMEVRDTIAYLRIIAQPHDDLALERIINTPKRGLGKATLEQLHTTARARNSSLYAATEHLLSTGELKGKTATTLQKLLDQFASWRTRGGLLHSPLAGESKSPSVAPGDSVGGMGLPAPVTPHGFASANPAWTRENDTDVSFSRAPSPQGESNGALSLAELTDLMLDESGYRPMWQADKSPEAAGRIDNLRELVRALGEFPNLAEFLEHVGLVTDNASDATTDMVSIMSLHAAKGLEFDAVFLAGWEEGIFPSQRTLDELGLAGLEEERRLAYVGITRARHHLTISHAANRRIYNQWQSSIPSRFLGEIPVDTIEFLDGGPYAQRASGPAMFQREVESILGGRISPPPAGGRLGGGPNLLGAKNTSEQAKPPPQPSPYGGGSLIKGSRVFHQKFGNGVILTIEGDHLEIAFKHAGIKKILAEYVELAGS